MKQLSPLLPITLSVLLLMPMAHSSEKGPWSWRGQTISEFTSETPDLDWRIVNDGVMGGLSQGKVQVSESGIMTFSGNLSLDNNGGFSLVRTGKVDFNLSNDLGLLLKVKGDGRTYEVRLESDARDRGRIVSFSGEVETTAGKWHQVKIPFSDFRGGWRGRDLPNAVLNTAMIQQVGIILADKKEGPFKLEVEYIRTYGKGQGNYVERETPKVTEAVGGDKNLIDTMVADGRFTTLKKALDTAGLTVFFQWDNPLTVFAPTDEAFAKLPAEKLEGLLKPEAKDQLVAILANHVTAGGNTLSDALSAKQVSPVKGGPINVRLQEGRVSVNDAVMLEADIRCTDGVIHAIDTVLLPST